MTSIKIERADKRAGELVRDPDAYFRRARGRALREAQLAVEHRLAQRRRRSWWYRVLRRYLPLSS